MALLSKIGQSPILTSKSALPILTPKIGQNARFPDLLKLAIFAKF